MSSLTISHWKLVWLALNNQLSLELRHQWLRRTRWDPVNISLRVCVFELCGALTGLIILTVFSTYFDRSLVHSNFFLVWMGSGIVAIPVGLIALDNVPQQTDGFNKDFARFLVWADREPCHLAGWDLQDLRHAAKEILIAAARARLGHTGDREAKAANDILWIEKMHVLSQNLNDKYRTFEKLGLAHGGCEYFTKEAKSILRAEAKATQQIVPA